MSMAVIYSSKTGNTRKIATAIYSIMPQGTDFFAVEEAPINNQYSFLALGFWVDRGKPDESMMQYMQQLQGKKIGLFATLAAWPDSDHAQGAINYAIDLLKNNQIIGSFICQGKIPPERLAELLNKPIDQHRRPMTPEKISRLNEAAKHPDELDCLHAKRLFTDMISTQLA